MAATQQIATMPTTDWIDICLALNEEFGESFPLTSKDVPKLLRELAQRALERRGA